MADWFKISDTTAYLLFKLLDSSTFSPKAGETGQPSVTKDGNSFTTAGVGALVELPGGSGDYKCNVDLTNPTLAAVKGDVISGRVKTTNTLEAISYTGIQVLDDLAWQRLVEGAAPIILGPVVGGVQPANFVGQPTKLAMFRAETKTFLLTVLYAIGTPVNLLPFNLRFVCEDPVDPSNPLFTRTETSGHITVSGASNEIANVNIPFNVSDITAGRYQWRLWDDLGKQVLQYGELTILPTSEPSS